MRTRGIVQTQGWLLTISMFLMAVEVTSQPIRFSTFYDSNNGAGLLAAVVLLDDGKLMAAGSNLNGSYSDGHNVVVDDDGNLLFEQEITFSGMTYNTQTLLRTSAGAVFSSGYFCDYTNESPGYCDFYFSKLDETGDTLFTKVLTRPDTGDVLITMVQTRPNKIMLIGWTYNDTMSGNADLLFITVDTMGNEVNRVVWGGSGTDYVNSSCLKDANGSVLMTGSTQSFGAGAGSSWVLETDSVGNVIWHEEYSGISSQSDGGIGISKLITDAGFIVCGAYNNSADSFHGYMMRIDSNGNQNWIKKYNYSGTNALYAVVELPDGSFVASGSTTNTDDESQAGWLIKTDANGDTLWTRTYNPSDGIDLIRNMLVLPNGDIVMVGFGRGENSTTQDGWILRVDSMGCLVEGCWAVGVEEQLVIDNEQFSIRPNPASEVLNLELLKQGVSEVHLYDMAGKLLFQKQTTQLREVIDVSALENGLYLISVLQGEMKTTVKVLVQH